MILPLLVIQAHLQGDGLGQTAPTLSPALTLQMVSGVQPPPHPVSVFHTPSHPHAPCGGLQARKGMALGRQV